MITTSTTSILTVSCARARVSLSSAHVLFVCSSLRLVCATRRFSSANSLESSCVVSAIYYVLVLHTSHAVDDTRLLSVCTLHAAFAVLVNIRRTKFAHTICRYSTIFCSTS